VTDSLPLLVIDDHPAVRAGVCDILARDAGLALIAAVGTAAEALDVARREPVAVALVDIRLPDMDGADLIAALIHARPGLKAIAFSSYCRPEMVRRVVDAGARGYLLKDAAPQDLRDAVRAVASGRRAFAPEASRALSEAGPRPDLTPREVMVLAKMSAGLSTREIAKALSISEGTAGVHIGHVLGKLGVPSRARAVALALSLGIIDPGDLSESR
jgi:DNA-binding NarL/FixJ family response regulator